MNHFSPDFGELDQTVSYDEAGTAIVHHGVCCPEFPVLPYRLLPDGSIELTGEDGFTASRVSLDGQVPNCIYADMAAGLALNVIIKDHVLPLLGCPVSFEDGRFLLRPTPVNLHRSERLDWRNLLKDRGYAQTLVPPDGVRVTYALPLRWQQGNKPAPVYGLLSLSTTVLAEKAAIGLASAWNCLRMMAELRGAR